MAQSLHDASEFPKWTSHVELLAKKPEPNVLAWLTKPYVLSRAFKQVARAFQLEIIHQGFGYPAQDELAKIHSHSTEWLPSCFIRQVFLKDGEKKLSYGRVVIPNETYERHFSRINQTGTNPFGETVLYSNPNFKRSPFEFAVIEPGAQKIYFTHHSEHQGQTFWGRRSLFDLGGFPILITEIFSNQLPNYPENSEHEATLSTL